MRIWLTLAILALVLTACGGGTPGETKLTADANGKTIDLTLNQTLVLTLDSNATTGYKWNLVGEPNAQVVKFISSNYNAPQTNPGVVGAGGTETWKFQAVGVGKTTFKLGYFRPFDPKDVAKEFSLTINVTPVSSGSSGY